MEKVRAAAFAPASPLAVSEKSQLLARLFAPTDIASLVFFRISFGLILLLSVIRYFTNGWIEDYIDPEVQFTYYGFGWVKPWPGWGMYAHFAVMGLAALGVTLGLFYRLSALVCFLTFTYHFLLEQSDYLNHYYLMCLFAFLMIFVPAHRALSLDCWRKPHLRSDDAPAWARTLLLAQISIVYLYAGIAKLNAEWLSAAPVSVWLPRSADAPVIGPFLASEWGFYMFAYGGLAFDLLIVPLMLWRRTRLFGFLWCVAFHVLNKIVFNIGVFPWLGIAATLLYFPPDWPRRWLRWSPRGESGAPRFSWAVPAMAGAYLLVQLLFPLRHFLYPGMVHWTEEGHRFSWHMMLNSKSGTATFVVTDPVTRETWNVNPREYLTRRQTKEVATCPDMTLQFAHFLAEAEAAAHNYTNPLQVRVISKVSLNGRPPQPLVDSNVNLAAIKRDLKHANWILPFKSDAPVLASANGAKSVDQASTHSRPTMGPVFDFPASMYNGATSITSLEQAAEQGDIKAQFQLSEAFRSGRGCSTNCEKALLWCVKAATAGLPEAQYHAALYYANGQGAATNLVQAMRWSTLAARQSHVQAAELKEQLRHLLTPFQLALARRLTSDLAVSSPLESE